ncbi:Mitochondrial acidic protein MAM33 [Smittium mucronatum]|uniref:Mitochondrial acidic protein MAM33 n=1 Tax=Smittium mucronatum TaxID=133383 RepID=A0A1R0H2R0_9FUNG|nr:Mitochondrial acidic protein MAM33 [Smittium mucronatum]
MNSFRSLGRVLVNSSRFSQLATRSFSNGRLLTNSRSGLIKNFPKTHFKGFSSSNLLMRSGENDETLVQTLTEEVKYEKAEIAEQGDSEFIRSFVEKTGFKIIDSPGVSDVVIEKDFGNEKIHVRFTINDISNMENEVPNVEVFDESQDPNGEPTKIGDNQHRVEDDVSEFYVNLVLTITKPNAPTLQFNLVAEEGEIGINQMQFFNDPKEAIEQSSESDYVRRTVYLGPVFGQLSDDLKEGIDQFLEDRGIDTGLSMFIQDYIEYKEQKEYLRWLEQFSAFSKA